MPEMRRPLERLVIRDFNQFTWGYHHHSYILKRAGACSLTLHEKCERMGYRNVSKFIRRESDWLWCLRPIPLMYLDTISCNLEALKSAVALDGEEYDQAIQFLPSPTYFVIRLGCGVCSRRTLPANCTLAQAHELIRQFQIEQPRLGCCLDWPGMRTLFFKQGELIREDRYRPQFILTREGVAFGPRGLGVGTTSL